MKKILFGFCLMLPFLMQAQLEKTLKKTIELKMPGKVYESIRTGGDSLPGTRGGAVAWHPVQKKYYAAFAGNRTFPLAVFDVTGKRLSDEYLTTMEDLRGLWYNPKLKKICGNGYYDIGWFSYSLDAKGFPIDVQNDFEGKNQPEDQCIGVYNNNSNQVCFLNGQFIYSYNADAMQSDTTIRLYPGISNKENIDEDDNGETLSEDYNYNVLIYTGIPKAEFGLLNIYQRQVELYNQKTGLLTQKLLLPADLPVWPAFNFSYSNGTYWAFDQETRTWTGYK
jgi:hypothetical protein